MFRIRRYRVVIFGVLLAWSLANRADAIRYELVDGGGGDQEGHTLSGFIEFDSPCGPNCTAGNIVDFAFSVAGPTDYSYTYHTPADVYLFQGAAQTFLDAGIAGLSVGYRRSGLLELRHATTGTPSLFWLGSLTSRYVSSGPGNIGGWETTFLNPTIAVIGVVVPEPATVATVFWGSVVSFLMARSREIGFTKNEGEANHVLH